MLFTLKDTKNHSIVFEGPAAEILNFSQFALSFYESSDSTNKENIIINVADIPSVITEFIESRLKSKK